MDDVQISRDLIRFGEVLEGIINSTKDLYSRNDATINDYDNYVIRNMTAIQNFEDSVKSKFEEKPHYKELTHFLYLQFNMHECKVATIEQNYKRLEKPQSMYRGAPLM